jgi:nucleoside phosphorylase
VIGGGEKEHGHHPSEGQSVATIGIIAALPKEFAALKAILGSVMDWTAPGRGAGRRYALANVGSRAGGVHTVALALLPDMGNNNAAIRATLLLQHFPSVTHVIMCGIAGGIPTPTKPERFAHLGDVVVANEFGVIQYDFVKHSETLIEPRGRPRPPAAVLREAVQYLEAERLLGKRPWDDFIPLGQAVEDGRRPSDDVDAEGGPITYPPDHRRRVGQLQVFSAPIAAANKLLKDRVLRDQRDVGPGGRVSHGSWNLRLL